MFCGPALRATLGHRAVTTATSALRSLALPRAVAVAAAATTSKWTTAVVGSSPCAGAGAAAVSKPAVRTMCAYVPPEGAVSVAQPAADAVRKLVGPDFKPAAGIVLGSGLGGVAEQIQDKVEIPYSEIPGFPVSSVSGHSGQLVCGTLEGVPVAALQGRVHLYEGVDPQKLRMSMYTFKLLGAETVFVTSAVGSTRPEVGPGELVSITDHINMQMRNPLIGPNDDAIGPRFPSLMDAYDPKLRALLHEAAKARDIRLTDGVFLSTLGPSFETPAEIRAYRILGGDVVGMSMVAEATVAAHAGLRVAAIGVVVNLASGMTTKHITHDETLHFSAVAGANLTALLRDFLKAKDQW